jgi:anti-anti-sigma factor
MVNMLKTPQVDAVMRDGVLIARLTLEKLGEYEANAVQGDLAQVARASGWKVVLDLQDVQLIASAGLGLLVSLNKQARSNKGQVVLCGLNDHLRQLLKSTRLDAGLTIKPDVEAGYKALK